MEQANINKFVLGLSKREVRVYWKGRHIFLAIMGLLTQTSCKG